MTLSRRGIPALTAEQMREVDRVMVEDLHIELIQMMENAGRNLAELAMARFAPTSVSVLAGPGGNGEAAWSPPAISPTAAARCMSSWRNPSVSALFQPIKPTLGAASGSRSPSSPRRPSW